MCLWRALLTKVSHWGNPGRQSRRSFPERKHESEDLRNGFPYILRDYGVLRLSQKNGCGTNVLVPQLIIFWEVIFMKKLVSVLLVLVCLAAMLAGCQKPIVIDDGDATVVSDAYIVSDTYIVIKPSEASLEGKTDMLLIDFMSQLKEKGELKFGISDGMVTSINGIDNPEDWSSCWMLYTSDAENSNTAWGTVEYEGKTYGSAISGAEALKIKAGELYIWVFQSFS